MGPCLSNPKSGGSVLERKRNQTIEKELRNEKKQQEQLIKLLLLGAGESGKSTFAKQMKLLFLKGYTEQELLAYKDIIHSNAIIGMRTIIVEGQKRDIKIPGDLQKSANIFTQDSIMIDKKITPDITAAVTALWPLPAIKDIYQIRHEYQLSESVGYYLDHIDRISSEGYVPTVEDVLFARATTIGIKQMSFTTKGHDWVVVDVGGQRNERRKWIHCFEDVTAIIFFADGSSYNMTLFEDARVNRLLESLTLFEEICNCTFFDSTPLILFLNKSDLLKQKILEVDIGDYFSDYTGGKNYENAVAWLKKKFDDLNRNPDKAIYIHVTEATNTENIRFVFDAVEEIILFETLTNSYLL